MILLATAGAIVGLAAVLLLLYPGELSWVSPKGTRWLYNRSAHSYEEKWQRHDYAPYDRAITHAAKSLGSSSHQLEVLDLCCGTGRATLVASQTLDSQAKYTAIDFSPAMLATLRSQIESPNQKSSLEINVVQADAQQWLDTTSSRFDLVLFMEAGEFLPHFTQVIAHMGPACKPGGMLVMTRPAGLWCAFFPTRAQTRTQLTAHLHDAGFADIEFTAWRKRYELVSARKI